MSNALQEFLTLSTKKAAADIEAALLRLPEDKRGWSPAETSRSALDQVAEVAILNGNAADLIRSKVWPEKYDFDDFSRRKTELAEDWGAMKTMLDENTAKVIDAINAVPEADLGLTIQMPWGPMTMGQIMAYPFWNMSYHEGQINYIASILECLP